MQTVEYLDLDGKWKRGYELLTLYLCADGVRAVIREVAAARPGFDYTIDTGAARVRCGFGVATVTPGA